MNDKKKPEIHSRFTSSDNFRCCFEIVRTDGGARGHILEVIKQFEFAFEDEPRDVEQRATVLIDEVVSEETVSPTERGRLIEEVRSEYNRVLGLHSW